MNRRPPLHRAIAQMVLLWAVTTAALFAVFGLYACVADEPAPVKPTTFRKTT